MPGLLDILLGRGSRLYPFEVSLIEAVIDRLSGESGLRLRKQVEAINKIQRIAEGKEVNLYKMSHGKPSFDDGLSFTGTGDEALLATVSLEDPSGKRSRLKVELWLAHGRLFSLVFNERPGGLFGQLQTAQPKIADVRIWFDPMQSQKVPRRATSISPSDWLDDWQNKGRISQLQIPLSREERTAALERIDAVLPADYVDLLSRTDGLKLGEYVVHGAAKIRKIVTVDANYYVLADAESNGLVVKEGGQDGELFVLDYEDESMWPVGKSLKAAIGAR
jgi:hypothetical protein